MGKTEWHREMEAKQRVWDSLQWRVAVASSALNAHIERRRTRICATFTALIYRMHGWKAMVYRAGTRTSEEAVAEVKARFRSRRKERA